MIYLRIAKLNYKEDPESKKVTQNDHKTHDRTEVYINHALKALSNSGDDCIET